MFKATDMEVCVSRLKMPAVCVFRIIVQACPLPSLLESFKLFVATRLMHDTRNRVANNFVFVVAAWVFYADYVPSRSQAQRLLAANNLLWQTVIMVKPKKQHKRCLHK